MFSKGESVLWKCVLYCGLRLRKAQGLISKTDSQRGIGLRGPLDHGWVVRIRSGGKKEGAGREQ